MNDGIDHNFCSLSYIKVDNVVRQFIQFHHRCDINIVDFSLIAVKLSISALIVIQLTKEIIT